MSKADLLRVLGEQIGCFQPLPKEHWRAPQFPSGVAKGIVAELMGNARIEWLLSLFALYPDELIFWCEHERQINPLAIEQRGVSLKRLQFIQSTTNVQQTLRLALESQLYPFVVAPNIFDELRAFQRLQLLAEKSKSTVFLLAQERFSHHWPIALQLKVCFSGHGFEIEVQRQRHGIQI